MDFDPFVIIHFSWDVRDAQTEHYFTYDKIGQRILAAINHLALPLLFHSYDTAFRYKHDDEAKGRVL